MYLGLRVRSRNDINDIDSYLVDRNDRVIDNFLNKEKKNDLAERINQMKSVSEVKIEKDMMNDIGEVINEYLKGGSVFSIEYKEEDKKNNCNDTYIPKTMNEKKIENKKPKDNSKKGNEENIIKKEKGKDYPKKEKQVVKQPEVNNIGQPIEKELKQPEQKEEKNLNEDNKETFNDNKNNQEDFPVKENEEENNNNGNLNDTEQMELQHTNSTVAPSSIETSTPNTPSINQSNQTITTPNLNSSISSLPTITISPNCTELSTSSSRSQLTHALESQKDQIKNLRQKLISLYLKKKKTLHEPPLFTSSELNNPSTFLPSSSIKSQYEDE